MPRRVNHLSNTNREPKKSCVWVTCSNLVPITPPKSTQNRGFSFMDSTKLCCSSLSWRPSTQLTSWSLHRTRRGVHCTCDFVGFSTFFFDAWTHYTANQVMLLRNETACWELLMPHNKYPPSCTHTHIHTHLGTHTYKHTHTHTQPHIHTPTHIHTYTHPHTHPTTYTHPPTYTHKHTYIYTHTNTPTHTHTPAHTYTHTNTHTTHTHTHTDLKPSSHRKHSLSADLQLCAQIWLQTFWCGLQWFMNPPVGNNVFHYFASNICEHLRVHCERGLGPPFTQDAEHLATCSCKLWSTL